MVYSETGDGHGSAVDWWTFGIFLYELLFGKTPFKGSGNRATLFNVVGQPLKFPESATGQVSFAARDLIRGLLVKEPMHRLAFKRGASEIKAHPFFEGTIFIASKKLSLFIYVHVVGQCEEFGISEFAVFLTLFLTTFHIKLWCLQVLIGLLSDAHLHQRYLGLLNLEHRSAVQPSQKTHLPPEERKLHLAKIP